jgi:diguanylate cyclase (GGDEF)-like protein/PAS domain S-box-containing protein
VADLVWLAELSRNGHWLTTANLLLSALLLLWLLRYVRLYRDVDNERARQQRLIDHLPDGVYRSAPGGRQLSANRALVRLNGYDSEAEMLSAVSDIGAGWYVEPGRRDEFKRQIHATGHVRDFVSEVYRHKTRERIWISEDARLVRDEHGVEWYEGTVRDVTESVRRRQSEERLEKLADNLPGGLFQLRVSGDGKFSAPYVSRGFLSLLAAPGDPAEPAALEPDAYLARIHRDDLPAYLRSMRLSAKDLGIWTQEFRYRRTPQSEWLWLGLTATPERLPDGGVLWHGHIGDISERKLAEEQVHNLAYVDSLTGLPNRRLFYDRLERAIAAARRADGYGAVLYLDLDNFKGLNDTQGHEVGDRLLRQVAERLSSCVRATDTVSRFGGDEFVIVAEQARGDRQACVAGAAATAAKILREFSRGFDLGAISHACSPSIGVVVFDGEAVASEVIKSADIAMYEAKKGGRNNYVLFDPASLKTVAENFAMQRELSTAIRHGELAFDFQPQVDADGRICGAEALVRWNHPQRGRLSPAVFVPIAEMTGMIVEINDWVLDEALRVLARWRRQPELRRLSLSVNVSVQQFRSPEFSARLARNLAMSGADPRRLTLELTEHSMARDPQAVAHRMESLKKAGVRFSLDDFGTGYSSLSQLNAFPFDEVKIDGAFVSHIEQSETNRKLIDAILGMANALGMETVAEHVSSAYQLEFLRSRGCYRYQGFHFHPPLEPSAFEELAAGCRSGAESAERSTLPSVAAPGLATSEGLPPTGIQRPADPETAR